jgi:hypothetical protein
VVQDRPGGRPEGVVGRRPARGSSRPGGRARG